MGNIKKHTEIFVIEGSSNIDQITFSHTDTRIAIVFHKKTKEGYNCYGYKPTKEWFKKLRNHLYIEKPERSIGSLVYEFVKSEPEITGKSLI